MADTAKKIRPVDDAPAPLPLPEPAPAKVKRRHLFLIFGFLLIVALPLTATAGYLWGRAVDQYASSLGFTVRQEEGRGASELLSGLTGLSSSGSRDSDILYEFIQSQELVAKIDAALDLRSLYSAHHAKDPLFAFNPDGTIEDLLRYWKRMVQVSYDSGRGLMELRVLAFDPDSAHVIATAILSESSHMINALSAVAREDVTRYAREDLDRAVGRLKTAREQITEFRSRTQIIDPSTVLHGQVGILNSLQAQLAETSIEHDLLQESTRSGDPRLKQIERKIFVIKARINNERQKFSRQGHGDRPDYSTLVSEFEKLTVDLQFAEETYAAARLSFDAAQTEAQRQSRYLAAFIRPTRAERAEYPQRLTIFGLVALFSALAWAILSLVYYSLRDRK